MNFPQFWARLQSSLRPGDPVANWTAGKGYLGDEFSIADVTKINVKIEVATTENIQTVPKRAFEVTYDVWDDYVAGKLARHEIRDLTRYSKYTISIIKHLES